MGHDSYREDNLVYLCSPVSTSVEGTRKQQFLGAGLKGTTEGEPLLHFIGFVIFFVFIY